MKKARLLSIFVFITACQSTGSGYKSESNLAGPPDTTVASAPITAKQDVHQKDTLSEGQLTNEEGHLVFMSGNQYSFIYSPYDFTLDSASVVTLLGENVVAKVEHVEGGEDYQPYSYFNISQGDTEISFYDYPGKHFCTVTTSRLPLKRGIVIGMKKESFLKAMEFASTNAKRADHYKLYDDYGYMDFKFQADTLAQFSAQYEEGD